MLPQINTAFPASYIPMQKQDFQSLIHAMRHWKTTFLVRFQTLCLWLCLAASLSACAGATAGKPVTALDTRSVAPVAVTVITSVARTDKNATQIDRNTQALAAELSKRLQTAHIAAYAATAEDPTPHPNGSTIALVVDIGRLQTGSAWSRELIGFGSGKSHLDSHVTLYDTRGAQLDDLLDFTVKADSGSMPGVAVSAWNPIGLGIHSAKAIASEAMSDGHEDADRTAKAIVKKMVDYYKSNGWLTADNTNSHG